MSEVNAQIARRLQRQQISDGLDGGFTPQMLAQLAEKAPAHGRVHISDMVLHARKKNRNNFD